MLDEAQPVKRCNSVGSLRCSSAGFDGQGLGHNDSERSMKTTCVLCTGGPLVGLVCLHSLGV